MTTEIVKIDPAEYGLEETKAKEIEAGIALGLMGQGIIDPGGGGEQAKKIVEAIKSGAIPHISINY